MCQRGNQQGKAQRAQDPHGDRFPAVEEKRDRTQDQTEGQDHQPNVADHAHKEPGQHAFLVQPAEQDQQRQQNADAAPELLAEFR